MGVEMGEKLAIIEINGWIFETYIDPKHLAEWQADGVRIFLVENTVPMWVASRGLMRPWLFLQDVFNFRNPWRN